MTCCTVLRVPAVPRVFRRLLLIRSRAVSCFVVDTDLSNSTTPSIYRMYHVVLATHDGHGPVVLQSM